MKVETLQELVSWCGEIHSGLADRMARGAERTPDGPTRWLMEYVARHEAQMVLQMEGLEAAADRKALTTWAYDWFEHPPPAPEAVTEEVDRHKAFTAVAEAVFGAHNEIMVVLRSLVNRVDAPEVEELIARMLSLEEGHTRQIAQQMNRIRDM